MYKKHELFHLKPLAMQEKNQKVKAFSKNITTHSAIMKDVPPINKQNEVIMFKKINYR